MLLQWLDKHKIVVHLTWHGSTVLLWYLWKFLSRCNVRQQSYAGRGPVWNGF